MRTIARLRLTYEYQSATGRDENITNTNDKSKQKAITVVPPQTFLSARSRVSGSVTSAMNTWVVDSLYVTSSQVLVVVGAGVPLEARPLESGGAHKSGGATLEVPLRGLAVCLSDSCHCQVFGAFVVISSSSHCTSVHTTGRARNYWLGSRKRASSFASNNEIQKFEALVALDLMSSSVIS